MTNLGIQRRPKKPLHSSALLNPTCTVRWGTCHDFGDEHRCKLPAEHRGDCHCLCRQKKSQS